MVGRMVSDRTTPHMSAIRTTPPGHSTPQVAEGSILVKPPSLRPSDHGWSSARQRESFPSNRPGWAAS